MVTWTQMYMPMGGLGLSALVALIPIIFFFVALAVLRLKGHVAGAITLILSILIAISAFKMPIDMAFAAAGYGFIYGLWPIAWIIVAAVFLYKLTVASGQFDIIRSSVISITRATVAPDWMSIPCGFMACDAQRVICRIDECRGWSAGLALAPVMFRAQLNEQDLPLSLTVVGIAPEKLSAWAGADAERLTVTALPAITTYGEPEGNLLTGPWQPRVSYRKQWARWRVMILPILLILVALAVERGVTLWSVSEQVAQSRTQAEEQFLTLFPEQKRIVNLRSQVTMALKKYRPQADDTRLLAELSAIASTLKSASLSDIEMRGFTFDQKRQILHLQLRAANFASFDKLRSALATDYVVQQDALQKEGDAVSGGVTLRRK